MKKRTTRSLSRIGYLLIILVAQSNNAIANLITPSNAARTNANGAVKGDFNNIREAYVEAQTVMVSSKAGQEAQQELKTKQEESLKRVQQTEQEFLKAQKEFASKASTLSPEAQDKEQKKLAKMKRDGEGLLQEIKEELQVEMYKKTEILDQELMLAAADFAKENNLDIVKDKATGRPLFVAQRLDCTEGLTKALDKQFDAKAKNKKNVKLSVAA